MSQRNRRQFLEESMIAAAAAAVATSSTVDLTRADDSGQDRSRGGANERLGVAVVGVRGRGGSHIGAFAGRKGTEILYLCDADREVGERRVTEVAKRQSHAPAFVEDMRRALEDPRVDIVSIATPNHWHALGAIWAMQAGKDVYVEKPVSHNVSEGRRIVETARKYNRICQTGTQCRSNPGLRAAIDFLRSGKIGKLTVARGLCYKRRTAIGPRAIHEPPASVNYNLWLGPAIESELTRSQFHYDWHWQWAYGNGDLGNQGIHQMDIARWGLGVDRLSDRVVSYGGRWGYEDAGETANTQVVVHDYKDKSLVFEVRGLETEPYKGAGVGVIFECTDGYLVVSSYESGTAFDLDGQVIETFSGGADHFDNFLKAVRSRKLADLNADIEEGHLSSALCHMGNISYRLGERMSVDAARSRLEGIDSRDNAQGTFERTLRHLVDNKCDVSTLQIGMGPVLTFDPKSETFPGSAAANVMLTREYRAPFVVPAAHEV